MNTETPDPAKGTTSAQTGPAPDSPTATGPPVTNNPAPAPARRHSRRRTWTVLACLVVLAAAAVLVWPLVARRDSAASATTPAGQISTVAVAKVTRETLVNEVAIPAEFRPYQEVELHAKVSGYVSEMKVDFGDQVKSNQPLATLEVPELQDQLHNAMAIQQRAEADYRAAHLNYTRLAAVVKDHPNLVAQQDLDTAQAKDGIADAAIAAAKADVEKYQTLAGYRQIVAPFDGVVTHRYVDKGTLIQAGTTSDTQSLPVVRVSDNYHLRLDFAVSVAYVKDIKVGDTVDVLIESLKMKRLKGTIQRFTLRVNAATRTMITEVEVDNPTLEIVPGMYATVRLVVAKRPDTLSIPTEAISGEKPTVYLVNGQNEIEERHVTLGLETPTRREVLAGLQEGDRVMTARRTQAQPGQKVNPILTAPLGEDPPL